MILKEQQLVCYRQKCVYIYMHAYMYKSATGTIRSGKMARPGIGPLQLSVI